jgi:hypothetical protein
VSKHIVRLQRIWGPEDVAEVIEAVRAVTETDAHVAESALLAEWTDREVWS